MNIRARVRAELPFLYTLPAIIWQLLFIAVPLIALVYRSLVINGVFSYAAYATLCAMPYVRIVVRSLLLAGATACTCLLLAYPAVYYIVFKVKRFKNTLFFFLIAPFWVNFLIQVYAWFFVLDHQGIINTALQYLHIINEPLPLSANIGAVLAVMVYVYLPFMILPLYAALEKMDVRLLDAAADLGASPWRRFVEVTFPLTSSGITTGFLLVLVPAFGEFVIPSLMGGSKHIFVGTLISHYFLVVRDNELGAACTVVSGILLIGVALLVHMFVRKTIAHVVHEE